MVNNHASERKGAEKEFIVGSEHGETSAPRLQWGNKAYRYTGRAHVPVCGHGVGLTAHATTPAVRSGWVRTLLERMKPLLEHLVFHHLPMGGVRTVLTPGKRSVSPAVLTHLLELVLVR